MTSAGSTPRTGLDQDEDVLVVWPGGKVHIHPAAEDDTVEAAVNGGPLRPVPGFVRAPEKDGEHWLAIASRDAAGNMSPVRWLQLRVDGVAPQVEVRFNPQPYVDDSGRPWVPPPTTVLAQATDRVAGVGELSLNVAGRQETAYQRPELSMSISGAGGEGPFEVRTSATDRVGNRSDEQSLEFFVDGKSPRGDIRVIGAQVVNRAGRLVVEPAARLTADIEDLESGLLEWRRLLNDRDTTEDVWAGPWQEGRYTVSAVAADNVGNESRIDPLEFDVDASPPEIRWELRSERSVERKSELYYKPPVEVVVNATDPVAGVATLEWSTDREQWASYDRAVTTPGEKLYLRATDRVGNRSEVQATWHVDSRPPSLFIETADGQRHPPGSQIRVVVGDKLRIVALDDGSGVEHVHTAYLWQKISLNDRFRFSLPGTRLFRIVARDALGNMNRADWLFIVSSKTDGSSEDR